jgi:hypothetical protein
MSDQSRIEKSFGTAWPFASPQAAETLQLRMQALLQEQAELLQETQTAMTAWMKRRQETIERSFRNFQAMCTSEDAAASTAAYGELVTSAMDGILVDINHAGAAALRLAEILQKSARDMFPNNADVPAPSTSATSSSAAGMESGRRKSAPPSDVAHKRVAAE